MSGDALILLVNIFDDQSVEHASDAFVSKLISAMPYVVDESTQNALISTFTVLLPHYEKHQPENNLVLQEFLQHEQEYKEKLLYLTVRGTGYRLDKSMQTIAVLLTNENTKGKFFSDNDFDVIADCCLRELESKNTSRARVQIMRVMCLILDHPTWMPSNYHRLSEFDAVMEHIVIHEDSSEEFVVKERE